VARREGIALSCHAPYYVNLNSPDKDKDSRARVMQAARVLALCGGTSCVFHAAFYQDDPPDRVYTKVKKHLQSMTAELRAEGIRVWLRPETTGKGTQFGSVDEVIRLSQEIDGVLPCVDFSHLHARTGGAMNTYQEFVSVLKQLEKGLGRTALTSMHIHVSGIAYGPKGEKNHLMLKDSDMNYTDLLRALKDMNCGGLVISESPIMEDDALLLQEAYERLP
jgi:deoxyribonuclease-4